MKVLRISYKGKEISRHRVSSPLVLIGRSPLCDIPLRTKGVGSVQFVLEWLGEGEFKAETASNDEWAVTEVGETEPVPHEHMLKNLSSGKGYLFNQKGLKINELEFHWIEDRLFEADLSKKILSQQLPELQEQHAHIKSKTIPSVLEVINYSGEAQSVSNVYHYSFYDLKKWQDPVLKQFDVQPFFTPEGRSVQLTIPNDAKIELIHQGKRVTQLSKSKVSLIINDLLHLGWRNNEYYFRIVPKVIGPTSRRSLVTDPFYLIASLCILVGAFIFYILYKNAPSDLHPINKPPRVAQIEVIEPPKPITPPPTPPAPQPLPEVTAPPELEQPPKELVENEKKPKPIPDDSGMVKDGAREAVKKVSPVVSSDVQARDVKIVKNAPKVVDKNKGGLGNSAMKAEVNRTGFLAALKKNKNVGMVKADQVLNNGIVADRVKGDKGNFVLEQSPSGVVNNKFSKGGDDLSAASTKVNLHDKVGSGSMNVGRGDVTKEGFKSNYGITGDGGSSGDNFGEMMDAQVEGGLDKASVRSAILGYKSEIRACYERALIIKAGIGGRVTYKFQINANGSVAWINIYKSDIDSSSLVNCVQAVINKIMFPKAKNGQNTIVIYPFQFARKGTVERKKM